MRLSLSLFWPLSSSLWLSLWQYLRAVALCLVAALAACNPSPTDKLARARALIDQPDLAAARVHLKGLIQDAPQSAEPRWLLGRVLLDAGDTASADIELRRALALGGPPAQVVPLLARTLLAAGQPRKLLDEFGTLVLDDPRARAELACALAQAQASLGDLPAARRSVQQALQAVPGFEPALLLQARVAAVGGDLAGASRQIDALLAQHPKNADGWLLKADLLARQRADPDALPAAYRQALALRPDDPGAHASLITLQLMRRDVAAATRQLQAMKTALPRHPLTAFYAGQLAFVQGDLPRARELFQGLLRSRPGDVLLLQSAAAVELRLGAPAQAEILLSRALSMDADTPLTRRLLAQTHLAQGQPAKALAVLDPLLAADPEALTLAAQAQLMAGNGAAAARLFERVAQLKPADPRIRTALALSHLAGGQDDVAITELQAVAASDPDTTADLALVSTHLQRRQYGAALSAIDLLERKQPDRPLAPHLRGQVQLLQPDRAAAREAARVAAREAFGQALARDARYWPSVLALAAMDVEDGQPDAAQARFEAQVKADPRNSAPRLALAELATRSGAPRETVALWLDDAVKANPGDLGPRLALIDHHAATYNPQAALLAAQAALVALPEQFDLLGRLGQAQRAAGLAQQAAATYSRMVALAPKASVGHLGLAEAQAAAGDLAAAGKTVRRLLDIAPGLLPAQRLAIAVALRQQQPTQALALARELQQQRPDQAVGYLLEGEVQLAQKQWDAAAAVLRRAVQRSDPALAPARLHHALRLGSKPADADAFAAAWLKDHPRDALLLFYLGDQALAQQDWALAEQRYQAVLALQPGHALALNNIAWLRLKQQLPGALPFAERAVAAAPHQPALMDTLAQALAANQQVGKAIALQQRALAMQPDQPGLRLNLARYYVQAQEKRLAKAELVRLEALGDQFAGQAEVAALSKCLGGR
jgi:putative PEP-CTERM system TPR-repeat lipoprotein